MSKSNDRKLTPKVPGVSPTPVPPIDPATVPPSFLDEIRVMENEGLIALDTAERSGENRGEYLDAINAELQGRIAKLGQGEPVVKPLATDEVDAAIDANLAAMAVPARVQRPSTQLPHPDDIDPAKITQPVLTSQGWLVPSTAVPPPIR